MSGGYGYPPYGPRATVAVPRMVAAALLALAAGLALGGSFGTFSVYGDGSESSPAGTARTTGWSFSYDPATQYPSSISVVLTGVALTVAAVLAFVVALLLVLTARRREDPGVVRSLGVGSCGLLVGTVLAIWMDFVASARNTAATASSQDNTDAGYRPTYELGIGAYLILVAALVALAAAVVLLVARGPAPTPVGPGTGAFPALGPGPGGPPLWQPGPQPWPQPGPGAPPPGWGPPAPPHHG